MRAAAMTTASGRPSRTGSPERDDPAAGIAAGMGATAGEPRLLSTPDFSAAASGARPLLSVPGATSSESARRPGYAGTAAGRTATGRAADCWFGCTAGAGALMGAVPGAGAGAGAATG